MRLREAHVPIVLWVVTAATIHWGGAEQSDQIARNQEGKRRLKETVQEIVVLDGVGATQADFDFDVQPASPAVAPPPLAESPTDGNDPNQQPDPAAEKKKEEKKKDEKLAQKDPPKPEPKKPEPPKVKPPEPKKEPVPPLVAENTPKPPEPPPPEVAAADKKISVIQNQKEDEAENPEAKYLAEKNHKVNPADEAHAAITSTTDNDPSPTPGTSNGKPAEKPGNADKDVIAQDEDRPGEKVSPNVVPKSADVPKAAVKDNAGTLKGDDKDPGKKSPPSKVAAKTPTPPPPAEKSDGKGAKTPTPGAPEVLAGPDGAGGVAKPAASANAAPMTSSTVAGVGDGKKSIPEQFLPKPTQGSGGQWVSGLDGSGPNGLGKLAISEKNLKAAVGMDELDRLKKVEGETKLSLHRGAWKSSSLERWRSAIENYTPGVKPGNQTNLGTAAAPWATYLAQIHVRMHPIFADSFVDSLDDLPAGHPLNDKTLVTRMEIVLKSDGQIDHLGIVRPSGVTAFDVAALDAVDRAAPFGKAPGQIVSPDGLVYLHWEFHRDEMRCSNLNAYPYVLKEGATPVKPEPKEPPPPPKGAPDDGKKYGLLISPKG